MGEGAEQVAAAEYHGEARPARAWGGWGGSSLAPWSWSRGVAFNLFLCHTWVGPWLRDDCLILHQISQSRTWFKKKHTKPAVDFLPFSNSILVKMINSVSMQKHTLHL